MDYKVTMTVRIQAGFASIEDFEREINMFGNSNEGTIEVIGMEITEVEAQPIDEEE